ncbi:hypothetical protein [Shimia sediminis]|uniref:hypothetical protein n=1 Tax=Shimia sediminis TaxID=2497945 RepID=UPI000F8DD355|nr:hypothetical protein [Shimia sediminis]
MTKSKPDDLLSTRRQTRMGIVLEFLALALVMISVPLIVRFDLVHLGTNLSEQSATEYSHNIALTLGCLLFASGAVKHTHKRGYLILVSGFLLTLVIRENDAILDQIDHGFWKYPAVLAMIATGVLVWRHRDTLRDPFLDHFESRSFAYFLTGLFIVLFFSRLFGSSVFLRDALGDNYTPWIKTIIQESSELLGYLVLLMGAFLSHLHRFSVRSAE